MDKDLQLAFDKAKIHLLRKKSTFITTILFSLKHQFSDEIPTAGTDGLRLVLNPEFFMALSEGQQAGLLAHEAWHVAFDHAGRVGKRDRALYNIAADIVINNQLLTEHFTLPPGGCYDFQLQDKSTEEIYELLKQEKEENGQQPKLNMADLLETPEDAEESQARAKQVEDILIRAAILTQQTDPEGYGNLPGDIKILIEQLVNPEVPWEVLLARYMTSVQQSRHNFKRPSRRFLPDFYLPTMRSPALENITIAVDTSASVSDTQFIHFISEVEAIHSTMSPEKITIISFDHGIRDIQTVERYEDIQSLSFTGRGGTCLHPLFDKLREEPPKLLIVFSDLDCAPIQEEPQYDVIWAVIGKGGCVPPFGKEVRIKELR